ncbi:MAG TPA: Clp protease N-terminal domain-containing protein [Terracidiphilus sp.]|nr:Clp protease N-terminal domain-containing protein [Terracidiphilus sp.]
MFERYTEKARRVIFFGRYEASQFGSTHIETEHLLLGLLREDKAMTNRFFRSHSSVESMRREIESHTTIREKVSTSVDLPLSDESKRVLAYAAEEAEKLDHKHIGTEHLLLGLLREENTVAAKLLASRGLQLDKVREEFARFTPEPPQRHAPGPKAVSETGMLKDLTALALDGKLPPIVSRDAEIDAILEVLSNSERNCPVLIGSRGAGKTAIVHGVAQRISDDQVPPGLLNRALFEVDTELMAGLARKGKGQDELLNFLVAISPLRRTILYFDCVQRLSSQAESPDFTVLLRWATSVPHIQCIVSADDGEFAAAAETKPWFLDSFREIHVRPLDNNASLVVLQARKAFLEQFHEVTYSSAALEAAFAAAAGHEPRQSQLATALALLDAAGNMVKLRRGNHSPEIAEVQKRIAFIAHRLEEAIANHEFEKARFYSDEERKEKQNLSALRENQNAEPGASAEVTPEDVQAVLSRWSSYPYTK